MSPRVNPVMYLISDPKIEMSKGKFAAQAAHAAVEAYKVSPDDRLKHIWDECGQQYAKVVLQTDDLRTACDYIEARGFNVAMIIDEGRTEFDKDLTPTFLGVQVVDKNNPHVQATFGAFTLYRDYDAETLQEARRQLNQRFGFEEKHSFIDKLKERARAYSSRRDSGHA